MRELSILIAARNEQYLKPTVEDVLAHTGERTEVIVVCDGGLPLEPLAQHPRLSVILLPESIGQRAAVNLAARVSQARYICKLDAHCAIGENFDEVLITAAETLGRDVVQIPRQHHLHVFNWKCAACARETYQGPTPVACDACKSTGPFEKIWLWERRGTRWRRSTEKPRGLIFSDAWRIDSTLHFQYFPEQEHRTDRQADTIETMSCLGACWFLDRGWFWELGGLDETLGSWGQMGQELACKAWLSGGRMLTNRRTWFAHLFRTKGGTEFGFPYPLSMHQVDHARTQSREMWLKNAWPKQIYPLRWLLEKFAPAPGWTQEQIDALPKELPHAGRNGQVEQSVQESTSPRNGAAHSGSSAHVDERRAAASASRRVTKGCVWYSDCRPDPVILRASQRSVEASGMPIVAVTLKPTDWKCARSIILPLERGYLSMFTQILAGLEALDTDYAFLVEHDVVYAAEHFAFTPPRDDVYYYNLAVVKVDVETGRAVTYETKQTSGLCANRQLLIEHYRKRIAIVERDGFSRKQGFEPGSHGRAERVDDIPSDVWRSSVPNLDIRHDKNLTATRWSPEEFRSPQSCRGWREVDEIPGWGRLRGHMATILLGAEARQS